MIAAIAGLLKRSRSSPQPVAATEPTPPLVHLEEMRRFDAAKDEFVGLVSQELRTPLTSVRGYLDLVLDGTAGDLTPDQERFLGVAARSCERLHALVDDLLVIAHAGAGRLSLEWERVDLVEVAREAVEGVRPAATERDVELVLTMCGRAPLLADRGLLVRLVEALVTSALAPTPARARLELGVRVDGERALVEIAVPAAELGIPGSGLLLAVARAIAEAHGGELTTRTERRTTAITVTVPTHLAQEHELQEEAA
jgi:signal transduction histidine kinase